MQPTLDGAASAALDRRRGEGRPHLNALDTAGAEAYPITASTYVLVYATIADATKADGDQGLAHLPADRRPGARHRRGLRSAAGRPARRRRSPSSTRSRARTTSRMTPMALPHRRIEAPGHPGARRSLQLLAPVDRSAVGAIQHLQGGGAAAGLVVLAILALHRLVHDQGGMAGLPAGGPRLHHLRRLDPVGEQVRGPRLHLRHDPVVGDRPRPRACPSASASPSTPTRWRPGGSRVRSST